MKLDAIELHRIAMPLVRPFRTSFGLQTERDVLLVRAMSGDLEGWGECVALAQPVYSSEHVAGAHLVMADHLVPRLLAADDVTGRGVAHVLDDVVGHRMAKGALELAVLDAELRGNNMPLARYLGGVRDRVDAGVSVGIADSIEALLEEVALYIEQGYRRIKLKIQPGWDRQPLVAVREEFGEDLPLQVDANTAYDPSTVGALEALDDLGLLLIEQPFEEEDLRQHADLARRIRTPVCLDESITSARSTAEAIRQGACEIVNVKAGRVGGYVEAARVHDVAVAMNTPLWCGGMLETGIGRAANVALASMAGFTLPGDTSASDRYYAEDVTDPFVMVDGQLAVPTGPGIGVAPRPEFLSAVTQSVERFTR